MSAPPSAPRAQPSVTVKAEYDCDSLGAAEALLVLLRRPLPVRPSQPAPPRESH